MFTLIPSIDIVLDILTDIIQPEKEINDIQIGKEEVKHLYSKVTWLYYEIENALIKTVEVNKQAQQGCRMGDQNTISDLALFTGNNQKIKLRE